MKTFAHRVAIESRRRVRGVSKSTHGRQSEHRHTGDHRRTKLGEKDNVSVLRRSWLTVPKISENDF